MDHKPEQPEENDPLWDLLGKSQPPQASPFFVSRVVNSARAEERNRVLWFHFLFRPTLALAAVAGVVLAVSFFREASATHAVANQDFEILSNLDNLIVMDTQVLWDDSSAYLNY